MCLLFLSAAEKKRKKEEKKKAITDKVLKILVGEGPTAESGIESDAVDYSEISDKLKEHRAAKKAKKKNKNDEKSTLKSMEKSFSLLSAALIAYLNRKTAPAHPPAPAPGTK